MICLICCAENIDSEVNPNSTNLSSIRKNKIVRVYETIFNFTGPFLATNANLNGICNACLDIMEAYCSMVVEEKEFNTWRSKQYTILQEQLKMSTLYLYNEGAKKMAEEQERRMKLVSERRAELTDKVSNMIDQRNNGNFLKRLRLLVQNADADPYYVPTCCDSLCQNQHPIQISPRYMSTANPHSSIPFRSFLIRHHPPQHLQLRQNPPRPQIPPPPAHRVVPPASVASTSTTTNTSGRFKEAFLLLSGQAKPYTEKERRTGIRLNYTVEENPNTGVAATETSPSSSTLVQRRLASEPRAGLLQAQSPMAMPLNYSRSHQNASSSVTTMQIPGPSGIISRKRKATPPICTITLDTSDSE